MTMKSKMTKRLLPGVIQKPPPPATPPQASLFLAQMAMAHSSPWTHLADSFPLPHWIPSCSPQNLSTCWATCPCSLSHLP